MNPKSFLFIKSWMQPLKALPLQQRWNVMEAIAEYSTSGCIPESLDTMETIAFGFIRNEIDRMRHHRNEVSRKRRNADNVHSDKGQPTAMQTDAVNSNDDSDTKACNALHHDAPYDIVSESGSGSESESGSEKKSSSTSSGVRMRGNAGKHSPQDDSKSQTNIYGALNQTKNNREIAAKQYSNTYSSGCHMALSHNLKTKIPNDKDDSEAQFVIERGPLAHKVNMHF